MPATFLCILKYDPELGMGVKIFKFKQVGDFYSFWSKHVTFYFFLFLIGVSKFDAKKYTSMLFILCEHLEHVYINIKPHLGYHKPDVTFIVVNWY